MNELPKDKRLEVYVHQIKSGAEWAFEIVLGLLVAGTLLFATKTLSQNHVRQQFDSIWG
jgi:hypothetical protein